MRIEVDLRDNVTGPLAKKLAELSPERVAQRVVEPCRIFWQQRLASLGTNKMGWPSTGFWEQAADDESLLGFARGNEAVLRNTKPGVAQRYHGGPITARDKALTIPARAEYYGHRATEFRNLRLVVFKSGAAALVEADATRVSFAKRKGGTSTTTRGASIGALVAYWLVKRGESTRAQAPNPRVVPTADEFAEVMMGTIERMESE